MLHIHGTADPLVPYTGAAGFKSVEETIDFWKSMNNCSNTSDTLQYANTDPNDSSTVERIWYANCGSGTEVLFYKITGGGHTWPNAYLDFIYGPTNRDFDASQEIWDFFNRFTLNGPVGLNEIEKSENDMKVFPNPSGGNFKLRIANFEFEKPLSVIVFDLSGRKILEQNVSSPSTELNLSANENGIYFLKVSGKDFWATKKIQKE